MKKKVKTIKIKIDIKSLVEAIENCNLGMGTYENPIAADYFVINLDAANSSIILPENISNEVSLELIDINDKSGIATKVEILGVFIYPSGRKETILSTPEIVKLFDKIFDCDDSYMNDRQFCIPVKDNTCSIKIKALSKNEINYYFTYRILFKLNIYKIPFCFSIDPFFKIRNK